LVRSAEQWADKELMEEPPQFKVHLTVVGWASVLVSFIEWVFGLNSVAREQERRYSFKVGVENFHNVKKDMGRRDAKDSKIKPQRFKKIRKGFYYQIYLS
jgi:hypothetical protein